MMKVGHISKHQGKAKGFSLLELTIAMAVMLIVVAAAVSYINVATQRSQAEQTKMGLTQEAREFVDSFERDLHMTGYPGCRISANGGANCSAHYSDSTMAVGLAYVSNYEIGLEGDVVGNGTVYSVWYRIIDSAGNFPPTGTCPCRIQRSQKPKVNGTSPTSQPAMTTGFSQVLDYVINSGAPGAGVANPPAYGGGLNIAGTTQWGASNTSYYAAMTTVKDFPVFTPYDQNGNPVGNLPLDIGVVGNDVTLSSIKSVRLTVNVLAKMDTGYDLKTRVAPMMTLVGDGRIANCALNQQNPCN